jgi:hypothetical protein
MLKKAELKFWDIKVIEKLMRSRAHLSSAWRGYHCTVCWHMEKNEEAFYTESETRCPSCWASLYTEDEIRRIVKTKKSGYKDYKLDSIRE